MSEKIKLSPKTKRIINIVVDVVVAVVLAFALFLAICTITSKKKGYDQYTEIFGTAYLGVASESMEPTFKSGDLIKIKTISASEASKLKEGDIITFKDRFIVNGKYKLNSHRIVAIGTDSDGLYFTTRGDNNPENMTETVRSYEIVGVYQGKASGVGNIFLFMSTSAGFFVCVVLPTLLIVVYCAVNLILVIRKEKKVQTIAAVQEKEDERERIRQELLAEMQANSAETAQPAAAVTEEVPQPAETESVQETEPQKEETTDEKDIPSEDNKTEKD